MNSALRLADLLESWTVMPQETPLQCRSGHRDELGAWRRVSDAVFLIEQVDRSLSGLRADGQAAPEWEAELPNWYGAVFSRDQHWMMTDGATRPVLAPHSLSALRMLGRHLERIVPEAGLTDTDQDQLGLLLKEVVTLAAASTQIAEPVRVRTMGLANAALRVLEDLEDHGTDQLRASVDQVITALGYAVAASSDDAVRRNLAKIGVGLFKLMSFGGGAFVGSLLTEAGGDTYRWVLGQATGTG